MHEAVLEDHLEITADLKYISSISDEQQFAKVLILLQKLHLLDWLLITIQIWLSPLIPYIAYHLVICKVFSILWILPFYKNWKGNTLQVPALPLPPFFCNITPLQIKYSDMMYWSHLQENVITWLLLVPWLKSNQLYFLVFYSFNFTTAFKNIYHVVVFAVEVASKPSKMNKLI